MATIKRFMPVGNGYGHGAGTGYGYSYNNGDGKGCGLHCGYDNGSGCGNGYGSGYGNDGQGYVLDNTDVESSGLKTVTAVINKKRLNKHEQN
jgi:hypothetical protein